MTDSRPENTNAADALLEKEVAEVEFGGKTYTLKAMGAGQVLRLLQLIGSEAAYLATVMQEDQAKPKEEQANPAELITIMLSLLNEEKLVRLIAILLNDTRENVKANWNTADALGVIDVVVDLEDIDRIFFHISSIGKKARTKMKERQERKSTASSKPSNTSVLNMVGKTPKSSESPSSGSTPSTPSPEEGDTPKS